MEDKRELSEECRNEIANRIMELVEGTGLVPVAKKDNGPKDDLIQAAMADKKKKESLRKYEELAAPIRAKKARIQAGLDKIYGKGNINDRAK